MAASPYPAYKRRQYVGPVSAAPPGIRSSGRHGHALSCEAHGLTRDNLQRLRVSTAPSTLYLPVGDDDLRLRAAFAPAFQLQQIAQFNVGVY